MHVHFSFIIEPVPTPSPTRRSSALVSKQRRLLHTSPVEIQQQIRLLQLSLQLDSKAAGAVVLGQPNLLSEQPSAVRVRVEQLAKELDVPMNRLLRLVGVYVHEYV